MQWDIRRLGLCASFLILMTSCWAVSAAKADIIFVGKRSAEAFSQSPAIEYISEEEWAEYDEKRKQFVDWILTADVLLIAKVERIRLLRPHMQHMQMPPVIQAVFRDIEVFKGKDPKKKAFVFSPTEGNLARYGSGVKVIVALQERKGFFSMEHKLLMIAPASELNMDFVEMLTAQIGKEGKTNGEENS